MSTSKRPPESIAVIGAGAAGLGAAWLLARGGYFVHLYEARDTAGGHAHTIDVPIPGDSSGASIPIDTGFIVYNTRTYPDLVSLFELLGVEEENSCMSFATSIAVPNRKQPFEWGSDGLATLFADRVNLYRLSMYTMLYDMRRFNRAVYDFVDKVDNDPQFADREMTLGEFLHAGGYSSIFIRCYLAPMVSAVWSASFAGAMDFPVRSLFHFFVNHGLAQVFARPQWRTPAARSRDYVEKLLADFRKHSGVTLLGSPVSRVTRDNDGVTVYVDQCEPKRFDQVVFATHAPTTLKLLGADATEDERNILGAFQYAENTGYIHYDANLMPKNRAVWGAWNFIGRATVRARDVNNSEDSPENENEFSEREQTNASGNGDEVDDDEQPVCVSYWLNKLQNYHKYHLPVPDLFITLNPVIAIDPAKILLELTYAHPQFTEEAVKAQPKLQEIVQGKNRSWFCGAYARFGFHEDAMMTGLNVAERLSGYKTLRPWKSKHRLVINDNSRQYELPYSPLRTPLIIYLGVLLILNAVISRLQQGLGKIATRMSEDDPVVVIASGDGRLYRFGPRHSRKRLRTFWSRSTDQIDTSDLPAHESGRVTVRSPKLLARVAEALRHGYELAPIAAAAFAASEYDCPSPRDLTITLKALFIAHGLDLDPSQARKGRAKLAETLLTSVVGGFKKMKTLPTNTRSSELTTCISSVVYPSWWLELERDMSEDSESLSGLQTLSAVSPSDLKAATHVLELLGDLSETTIAVLQGNKECRAKIVVRTSERVNFVNRKAELLFVRRQVEVVLLDEFLDRKKSRDADAANQNPERAHYSLILSPAILNLYQAADFTSLEETLLFLRDVATRDAVIEVGATVYGYRRMAAVRRNGNSSDSVFSGDDGYRLMQTREILEVAETSGFELQRVAFMNSEEAAMDVSEVIQRVYNSLARDKLEPDETRLVLAQMCLWEAALQVKYIRRMAASFTIMRISA